MQSVDYTFLVGAPGSRWSGVGQIVADYYNYNKEDETDWRVYRHGDFSGHRGAYWGPGMELGQNFHMLKTHYNSNVDGFLKDCDKAWDGHGTGTRMVKCHQFAYNLDWIYNNIPNSNILLVKRDNQKCFDWWKQAGGWEITYPNYEWYVDDSHMRHYIEAENNCSMNFVAKHSKWETLTESWLSSNFGDYANKLPDAYNDVEVALVKTVKKA